VDPNDYLYNSASVRLAVLQGLLDSDGEAVIQQDGSCSVRYATHSPHLRDQVAFLVRSMGGVAFVNSPDPGVAPSVGDDHDKRGHRLAAFVLDIQLPSGVVPFRLSRKRDAYADEGAIAQPVRFIEQIKAEGVQDTLCIRVAASDSLYVTDDFLVTHNTLNDSFVILDEAQNTTPEQMKMFLTRLGFNSKAVITGDVTQVDLPEGRKSGLSDAVHLLADVEGIRMITFTDVDVVRHPLVARIVRAYEARDSAIARGKEMREAREEGS
jgi:phosphate starvation-inducible protein PhoH and related proteins